MGDFVARKFKNKPVYENSLLIHDENTKEITTVRRLGYLVLICIEFGDFIPSFSPHLMISLRSDRADFI